MALQLGPAPLGSEDPTAGGLTCLDWQAYEQFLLLELRWSPATVYESQRVLRREANRGLDLEAFTIQAAKTHTVSLLRAGTTPTAVNNATKAMKALARFKELDAKALRLLPPQRSRYKFLTDEQVSACLNYRCYPKRLEPFRRALLLLSLKTGLRLGELSRINASHLDRTTTPNRVYVATPSKRGSKRWIPIEPWVLSPKRALGAYLSTRKAADEEALLFWSGKRAGPQVIRREFQQISRDLGFLVNCTVTRHTRATELRRRGWDILALQHYLGHANVSSTAIYAAVTPADLQDLMRTKASKDPWVNLGGKTNA